MDETELTAAEQAELRRVDAMLADPSLWTEPPAGLEDKVLSAIAAESAPTRRRRPARYLAAAAAVIVLAAGAGIAVRSSRDTPVEYRASMTATGLAPDAAGTVTLVRTVSGWRTQLHVAGLPRRDHGLCYEAWLKNDQGVLVSIGTFNQGDNVVLWSGVSPRDFGTVTVTREVVDGNPASSGQVVVSGRPARS